MTRRHGALLIFDEIVTGFRLARAGAQEFFGVVPDLAVFAKGLANGMPLSCYLGRRDVMETVRQATISSTLGGETLSLAAGRAAIDTYRGEDVIGRLWALGRRLQEGLARLLAELDAPASVEGYPPCPQLRFHAGDPARDAALLLRFEGECLRRGVLPYTVLYVNYSHTEAEIDTALSRMEDALRVLRRDGYRGTA
jgi:glutamate-1-semialdehyde aminotransferase